jgi:peroxiredoxin
VRGVLIALAFELVFATPAWPGSVPRQAPDFSDDISWLNQGNKVGYWMSHYRGKVLLVNFWEYTCINCLREIPELKLLYAKYHPYGFEVVGIHDGEFSIGNKLENVKRATQRLALPWPVVYDAQGSMWRAYGATGWPTNYLIDQRGMIVLAVLGEGKGHIIENRLRGLLAQSHADIAEVPMELTPTSIADCGTITPETYVGEANGRGALQNKEGYRRGKLTHFKADADPNDGQIILSGEWKTVEDSIISGKRPREASAGSLSLRYHATSVYAVLSRVDEVRGSRIDVTEDGHPLTHEEAGGDIRFDESRSLIEVTEPRLYSLIRNKQIESHILTLTPQSPDLAIHSFTYRNNCEKEIGTP